MIPCWALASEEGRSVLSRQTRLLLAATADLTPSRGRGAPCRFRYFWIVRLLTRMPSWSSSPRIRSAPQSDGLAALTADGSPASPQIARFASAREKNFWSRSGAKHPALDLLDGVLDLGLVLGATAAMRSGFPRPLPPTLYYRLHGRNMTHGLDAVGRGLFAAIKCSLDRRASEGRSQVPAPAPPKGDEA